MKLFTGLIALCVVNVVFSFQSPRKLAKNNAALLQPARHFNDIAVTNKNAIQSPLFASTAVEYITDERRQRKQRLRKRDIAKKLWYNTFGWIFTFFFTQWKKVFTTKVSKKQDRLVYEGDMKQGAKLVEKSVVTSFQSAETETETVAPSLAAASQRQKEEELIWAKQRMEQRLKELRLAPSSSSSTLSEGTSSLSSSSAVTAAAVVVPTGLAPPLDTPAPSLLAPADLLATFPDVILPADQLADPFYLQYETGPVDGHAVYKEEEGVKEEGVEGKREVEDNQSSSLMPVWLQQLQQPGSSSSSPSLSLATIKSKGRSGIVAYILTEIGFWALYPTALYLVNTITSSSSTMAEGGEPSGTAASFLGLSVLFVSIARFAVPLCLAMAFSLIPWVEENITEPFFGASSGDGSSSSEEGQGESQQPGQQITTSAVSSSSSSSSSSAAGSATSLSGVVKPIFSFFSATKEEEQKD